MIRVAQLRDGEIQEAGSEHDIIMRNFGGRPSKSQGSDGDRAAALVPAAMS